MNNRNLIRVGLLTATLAVPMAVSADHIPEDQVVQFGQFQFPQDAAPFNWFLDPAEVTIVKGGSVTFEINVRFSGTTPMRARLGFNEVEAALRHYVLGEDIPDLPRITDGIAVRYWNELYVAPEAYAAMARDGKLDDPHGYATTLEDYGSGKND